MESVLYVCDLLSGMTRKGNIQISIQHKGRVSKSVSVQAPSDSSDMQI